MDDTTLRDLDRESYISLATFRKSGVAVETPVWFAREDDKLYVFSEATAGKMKRLRNDPHVRVAACSMSGRVYGGWYEGHAHRVEGAAEERAYATLRRKYGWQMTLVDLGSRLTGRIGGRAVIEIALD